MNLAEFRKKYPQYDNKTDEELARGLHRTYYSNLDFNDFAQKIGYNPQPQEDVMTEFSPEKIAQNKAMQEEYNSTGRKIMRGLRGAADFLTGTAEGVDSGTDSVMNGLTFGFYDKISPTAKERRETLQRRADAVGLGTANKIAQGTAEFGGMGLNPLNYVGAGYIGRGANVLNKALRSAGVGGVIGGIAGAGNSESLEELPQEVLSGVGFGSALGGALPLTAAAVRGAGKFGKNLLGYTTGAGSEAIDRAFDAGKRKSKVFLDNMRGKAPLDDVKEKAMRELSYMKEGNNELYRNNMEKAFSDNTKLNISKILDEYNNILNKASAGGMKTARGEEKKVLKEIAEYLKPYTKNENLRTTEWLDDLRQDIRSIKTDEGTKSRLIQKKMENIIKDVISEQRPEYRKGLETYAKNKTQIKEIMNAFSLGEKSSTDTALRKIQSLGRNNVQTNYGYRNKLMDILDSSGDIRDAAAGQLFNTWTPRGLQAKTIGGVNLYTAFMNPEVLPESIGYAAASSPRLMGELIYDLGRMSTKLPSGNISPYLAQLIAQNQ